MSFSFYVKNGNNQAFLLMENAETVMGLSQMDY